MCRKQTKISITSIEFPHQDELGQESDDGGRGGRLDGRRDSQRDENGHRTEGKVHILCAQGVSLKIFTSWQIDRFFSVTIEKYPA